MIAGHVAIIPLGVPEMKWLGLWPSCAMLVALTMFEPTGLRTMVDVARSRSAIRTRRLEHVDVVAAKSR